MVPLLLLEVFMGQTLSFWGQMEELIELLTFISIEHCLCAFHGVRQPFKD